MGTPKLIIETVGLIAAVIVPFWNIPLIVRIIRRRSSEDVSIHWAVGVWGCLLLMAPSGFISKDLVWRMFNIINFILFSCVMLTVIIYRKRSSPANAATYKERRQS